MLSGKKTLDSNLWELLNLFRGSIEINDLIKYILVLVFLKHIDEKNKSNSNFNIIVPENCDFDSLMNLANTPTLGDEINRRLNEISIVNPILDKVFDNVDFNNTNVFGTIQNSTRIITSLLKSIDSLAGNSNSFPSNNTSVWTEAFDSLMQVRSEFSGKSFANISTPKEVCELISKLISFKSLSRIASIYDPTCGSGDLLASISNQINSKVEIFGQEINPDQVLFAKLNLLIHGISDFQIELGDVLNAPIFKDSNNELMRFDYVVANPPFNLKMWNHNQGYDSFDRWNENTGIPPTNSGDFAFLLHIVNSLKINGVGACIVSNGTLFREGEERTIRKYLIEKGFIKGIIGLPAKLFFGTGIPSSIIILNKQLDSSRNDIFIIDASSEHLSERLINRLSSENIERIVDTWKDRRELSGFSRLVSYKEIVENDFSLNIPRYLINIEEFIVPDGSELVELSSFLSILPRTRANNESGKLVRISDLANDSFLYTIDLNSLSSGEANRNFLMLNSPALLISKRFNKLKPSFCNASSDNPVYISPEIEAFSINENSIELSYLIIQLNSDYVTKQVESFSVGAVMPSLRRQDIMRLNIVVPSLEQQFSLVRQKALAEGARIQSDKAKIESLQLQKTIDTLLKERLNDFQWKLHDIRNGELLNLKGQVVALEMFAEANPSIFNKVFNEDSSTTALSSIKEIYNSVQRLAVFLSDLYNASDDAGKKEDINILDFITEFCVDQLNTNGDLFEIDYADVNKIKNDFEIDAILISANKKDLQSVFSNVFENAIRHGGFVDSNKVNRLKIAISLDAKKQRITVGFLNNGKESNISEIDYFADGGKAGSNGGTGKGGHIIKVLVERNNGKAFQKNWENGEAGEYNFEVGIEFNYKK